MAIPTLKICVLLALSIQSLKIENKKLIHFFMIHFFSLAFLLAQTDRGLFHFRRAAFAQQLKNRVVLALIKVATLRITFNLDGTYTRRVDSSDLVFSLSSHRHSYIGLVFSSHFID
jgi:hypothetical protein